MKIPHPRARERLLFAFIGSHLYSSQQYSSQFQENKNHSRPGLFEKNKDEYEEKSEYEINLLVMLGL